MQRYFRGLTELKVFCFVLFFFSSKYYLACLQFILSFRRWIYIRMEHKKQSLEFWNHSERVDGNLPAEVNYKPRVMFARPCLSRDTMRAHKEFRRTCKLALWYHDFDNKFWFERMYKSWKFMTETSYLSYHLTLIAVFWGRIFHRSLGSTILHFETFEGHTILFCQSSRLEKKSCPMVLLIQLDLR